MITLGEIGSLMSELEGWSLEGNLIMKEVNLDSFKDAIDFVNRVAEVAEKVNHRPTIFLDGSMVRLYLTTREEDGLSRKDFEVAKEIDGIGK